MFDNLVQLDIVSIRRATPSTRTYNELFQNSRGPTEPTTRNEVRNWEFFGLGLPWLYGVPEPRGAAVRTVTSGDQARAFYGDGASGPGDYCDELRDKRFLGLWQTGQQDAGG